MASNRFTPVPSELFDDAQTETLFYHNHPKKENETVLYNVLPRNNITIIFGMDKSAYLFLKEQYPEARFYSQASPLSEYFSIKSRLGNSKKMYVSLRKNAIDLFCYERGHLLLSTPLNVNVLPIAFIIYFMPGNNWILIRNGMSFILPVSWQIKKH